KLAAKDASTHSFHVAMALSAGLLIVGAGVNWFGIRNRGGGPVEAGVEPAEGAAPAGGACCTTGVRSWTGAGGSSRSARGVRRGDLRVHAVRERALRPGRNAGRPGALLARRLRRRPLRSLPRRDRREGELRLRPLSPRHRQGSGPRDGRGSPAPRLQLLL